MSIPTIKDYIQSLPWEEDEITLRDIFAMQALDVCPFDDPNSIVDFTYRVADAMLENRRRHVGYRQ